MLVVGRITGIAGIHAVLDMLSQVYLTLHLTLQGTISHSKQ